MRHWLWMTGGLVVWASQFSALYALSSFADVVAGADDPRWRIVGLAITIVGAITCAVLLRAALQRRTGSGFADDIAALSAGVGLIAVSWQGLPTVIGY